MAASYSPTFNCSTIGVIRSLLLCSEWEEVSYAVTIATVYSESIFQKLLR